MNLNRICPCKRRWGKRFELVTYWLGSNVRLTKSWYSLDLKLAGSQNRTSSQRLGKHNARQGLNLALWDVGTWTTPSVDCYITQMANYCKLHFSYKSLWHVNIFALKWLNFNSNPTVRNWRISPKCGWLDHSSFTGFFTSFGYGQIGNCVPEIWVNVPKQKMVGGINRKWWLLLTGGPRMRSWHYTQMFTLVSLYNKSWNLTFRNLSPTHWNRHASYAPTPDFCQDLLRLEGKRRSQQDAESQRCVYCLVTLQTFKAS